MTVRILNQNRADFAQSIVNEFDRIHFPGTRGFDIVEPSPRRLALIDERRGIDRSLSNVISEIRSEIALQSINFSQWSVIIGITDPVLDPTYRNEALVYGAAKLADRLNVPANLEILDRLKVSLESQTPRVKLLTYVFEEAFRNLSVKEQLALIEKMRSEKTALESASFRAQMAFLRVQVMIAGLFGHPNSPMVVGMLFVTLAGFFVLGTWGNFCELASTYISKIFKIVAKRFPRTNPSIILRGFAFCFIGTCSIVLATETWFMKWVTENTPRGVTNLATVTRERSNWIKRELILKAYQLWMHLMQNPENFYDKKTLPYGKKEACQV